MIRGLLLCAGLMLTAQTYAATWQLPEDKGLVNKETISKILSGNDYPETTTFSKKIEYIDFNSHGQPFTQVVVTLTPRKPLMHNGRKVVVVGAEPGSEYAMDFLETPEGKEGAGIWLAKRGVTFVALTRVGRWNFFAKNDTGSWADIPLEQRMPIYNRQQKAPWTEADFGTEKKENQAATSGDSSVYRFPKPESPLYNQTLAATPLTFLKGYQKAIEHVLPPSERKNSLLLYWGMSTGGAFLYPLASYAKPDGYLGWGTSSTGIAYSYRKATQGDFNTPYAKTAMRLRERGYEDFRLYTKQLDEETRQRWWKGALKGPRFKSGEDAAMQFNAGALTETAMRLWLSDFLPAEDRKDGLGGFVKALMEPSFPPAELKSINVLEINGTRDEAISPKVANAHREVMESQAKNYRNATVEDFQHYLFTQDSIKTVGTLWLRFISSGYFDKK